MSANDDPPRFTGPDARVPEGLRRVFQDVRRDLPSAHDLGRASDRLERRLSGGDGAPTSSPIEPPARPSRVPLAPLGKTLAVVLLAAGAVGLVVGGSRRSERPAASAARTETASTPGRAPGRPEPPAAGAVGASSTVPGATATPAAAVGEAPAGVGARPVPPLPGAAIAKKARGGSLSGEPAPSPPNELELLQRARSAIRSDPRAALRLAAEHERLFPRGALAQEREVIVIDSLVELGQVGLARARANRFNATYPASPHRQHIESLFSAGGHQRSSAP